MFKNWLSDIKIIDLTQEVNKDYREEAQSHHCTDLQK